MVCNCLINHLATHKGEQAKSYPWSKECDKLSKSNPGKPTDNRHSTLKQTEVKTESKQLSPCDWIKQDTSKLSGGERQRVAVARAIVGRPALVLADEPTGNLDSKSCEAIVELLEELNSEGITLVVITHNPEIADRFPRQVSLRDGMIEADSTPAGVA